MNSNTSNSKVRAGSSQSGSNNTGKMRIDPHQLLGCLSVLLNNKGGINTVEDCKRMAVLMSKYCKKLVSKCVYLNILTATEEPMLDDFFKETGWDLVKNWLKEAVDTKNFPLAGQILDLLFKVQVTYDRLKRNTMPQLVMDLSLDCPNLGARQVARSIVVRWKAIVKANKGCLSDSSCESMNLKRSLGITPEDISNNSTNSVNSSTKEIISVDITSEDSVDSNNTSRKQRSLRSCTDITVKDTGSIAGPSNALTTNIDPISAEEDTTKENVVSAKQISSKVAPDITPDDNVISTKKNTKSMNLKSGVNVPPEDAVVPINNPTRSKRENNVVVVQPIVTPMSMVEILPTMNKSKRRIMSDDETEDVDEDYVPTKSRARRALTLKTRGATKRGRGARTKRGAARGGRGRGNLSYADLLSEDFEPEELSQDDDVSGPPIKITIQGRNKVIPTKTVATPTKTVPTPTKTVPTPTKTVATPTKTVAKPTKTRSKRIRGGKRGRIARISSDSDDNKPLSQLKEESGVDSKIPGTVKKEEEVKNDAVHIKEEPVDIKEESVDIKEESVEIKEDPVDIKKESKGIKKESKGGIKKESKGGIKKESKGIKKESIDTKKETDIKQIKTEIKDEKISTDIKNEDKKSLTTELIKRTDSLKSEGSSEPESENDSKNKKTDLKKKDQERTLKREKSRDEDRERKSSSDGTGKSKDRSNREKERTKDRDKERSKDSHKSSSSSSRDDKDRHRDKDKHRDKDRSRHRDDGNDRDREKSSSDKKHKSSSKDSDRRKEEDRRDQSKSSDTKRDQADKDKETLAKIKPLSSEGLAKIPKKPPVGFLDALGSADSDVKKTTVKVKSRGFRDTGLMDEPIKPPGVAGKRAVDTKSGALPIPKKIPAPLISPPCSEKKVKTSAINIDRPGGIKIISPKRPSLADDGGFMAALTAAGGEAGTRKKVSRKRKSSESDPKLEGTKAPKLDCSKDSVSEDDLLVSPVKDLAQPSLEIDVSKNENADKTAQDVPMLSPTSIKPTLNFYKERSSDELEKKEEVKKDSEEESIENDSETSTKEENEEKMDVDVPAAENGEIVKEETGTNGEDDELETCTPAPAPAQEDYEKVEVFFTKPKKELKGVLRDPKSNSTDSKKKKKVHWRTEDKLSRIFFFPMDESERENVNATKFKEMFSAEKAREKELNTRKGMFESNVQDYFPYKLYPIHLPNPPKIIPGCKSEQKMIQADREHNTMATFFPPGMMPDTPKEPDPEMVPRKEPIMIPLLGEDGGNVVDYTKFEWPQPLAEAPAFPFIGPPGVPMPAPGAGHWVQGNHSAPRFDGMPMFPPNGPNANVNPVGFGPQGYPQAAGGWNGPPGSDFGMMMNMGNPPMMPPNMGGGMPPMNMGGMGGPPMNMPPSNDNLPPRFSRRGGEGGGRGRNIGDRGGRGGGWRGNKKIPCKHFQLGHCRNGSNCNYKHIYND